MSVSNSGRGIAINSKSLDHLVERVELLSKVERSDEYLVPTTALVWESGEALRSDPLKEVDVRDINDTLRDASTEIVHALLSKEASRLLNKADLVAATTTACASSSGRPHSDGSAGATRRRKRTNTVMFVEALGEHGRHGRAHDAVCAAIEAAEASGHDSWGHHLGRLDLLTSSRCRCMRNDRDLR